MKSAIVVGTHTMGLGMIRALGLMGVPIVALYYSKDEMGFVSKYVQESIYVPHPENQPDEFIAQLIKIASRYPDVPLFPSSDAALKVISKNKELLDQYFRVACADWTVVRELLEKNNTYILASSVGVAAPITFSPLTLEEAIDFGKKLEYPYLLKPVESHRYVALFRKKLSRVDTLDQLIASYTEAANAGVSVMLQELIPGDDSKGVNYNSYFWEDCPVVEFTAQKIRNSPPHMGSPCAVVSRHIPEVLEPGRKILRAMGYYGYSCTEFKRDPRDGKYKLLEVNGRHNLSTLLAVKCGINFPWLHYRHLVDGIIPQQTAYKEDLYWIDFERDAAYIPRLLFIEKEGPFRILEPYLGHHIFSLFDFKDLRPFLKRYRELFGKAFASIKISLRKSVQHT